MHKTLLFLVFLFMACKDSKPDSNTVVATVKTDTIQEEPVEEILPEPKMAPIDYDSTQWTEPVRLDESIVLDMRYATTNNFVEEQLYDCGRCFLRPEAAKALVTANEVLKTKGYSFKMYDCFRPLPIQQKLWDKFQNPSYVTPPSKGSMHNRGLAVDLTIVDEKGEELDMGTEFDFFGEEAHHTYTGHSKEINENRKLLKETLEAHGFKGIRTEWWHYSFSKKRYSLSEMLWKCE